MALVTCPDCGKSVSTLAESCPQCGYPIGGGGTSQTHGGKIQTIEKTSKPYKLQQILSCFTMLVGLCAASGAFSFLLRDSSSYNSYYGYGAQANDAFLGVGGFVILAIGIIWFVIVRFIIWWQHG